MARLGEPEKSSSSKTFIGVLIILIALGALGAIGFLSFRLSSEPGLTAELCRQIVESKIDAALVGTRVSFSTVNPDSDIRQSAFFSICKPPSGDDASRLTENPRMVQEKYEKEFLDPVDDALDDLLTIPEAPSSPIMEGLQEFASRIPEFTTTDRPRELVIMSDLMQHSDAFSFYRGGNWKSFSDANGPERFGFTFKNADITVLRIPRLVEMAAVVDDFWVRYLMIQGFDDTNIISIGDL
jgi:hypothetical protein